MRSAVTLGVFLAAVYLLTAAGHVFSFDGSCRMELARSLVERHDVQVPCGLIQLPDGRRVAHWLPLQSLVAVPAVAAVDLAARAVGVGADRAVNAAFSLQNQLFTALCAALIAALLVRLGYRERTALLTGLAFGLCSYAWPVSKDSFEGPLEAAVLLGYALAMLTERPALGALAWAMLLLIKQPCAALLPGLALLAKDRRGLAWLAGGALLGGAGNVAYNLARFGDPFETGSRVIAEVCAKSSSVGALFSHSVAAGVFGYTVSLQRGLLWFAPLTAVAVAGWRGFAQRAPRLAAALALALVPEALVYCAFIGWHGAWCWGPRYVFGQAAALTLPLAEVIERGGRMSKRAVAAVAIAGFLAQLPAVAISYHRAYYRALAAHEDFTALGWAQPARQFAEAREVLCEPTPPDLVFHAPDRLPPLERIHREATLDLPDFWWVYAGRAGVPLPAVAALLLVPLAAALASGAKLLAALARGADGDEGES